MRILAKLARTLVSNAGLDNNISPFVLLSAPSKFFVSLELFGVGRLFFKGYRGLMFSYWRIFSDI